MAHYPDQQYLKQQANQQMYNAEGGLGTANDIVPDSVASVLPRVQSLAVTVRDYAEKQTNALNGVGSSGETESMPQRSGLVGALQDIEDNLRTALKWMDEAHDILNG